MPRVLLSGNCHAVYLGAALERLTDVEVRVAAKLFPGIAFSGHTPTIIDMKSGLRWLSADPENAGVLLRQITPSAKVLSGLARVRIIGFPYFKFDAPFYQADPAAVEEDPEKARAHTELRVSVLKRADRLFNEMSCLRAKVDVARLDDFEAQVRAEPILYSPSHLSGKGMAFYVQLMEEAGLGDAIGAQNLLRLKQGVSRHPGIGAEPAALPDRAENRSFFQWWPGQKTKPIIERLHTDAHALARDLRRGLSLELNARVARAVWVEALKAIHRRVPGATGVALALYRPRLYGRWAKELLSVLRKKERKAAMALLIRHRLTLNEMRDYFLAQAEEPTAGGRPIVALEPALVAPQ